MRPNISEYTIILKGKIGILYTDPEAVKFKTNNRLVKMTEAEAR